MSDFPLPDAEDDEEEDDGAHGIPIPDGTWPEIKSLWVGNHSIGAGRWATRIGGTANTIAGIGGAVAKNAAVGGIATKVGLGAAAGALTAGTGGLAVVVGAGVLQITSMVNSARSASKTWEHLKHLKAIQGRRHYKCTALGQNPGAADHGHIHNNVIQYIINKKSAKLVKKGVGAVGGGSLTGIFGVVKNLYKRARGTLGKRRSFYAYVVARHMITHDCALCEALVSELFNHHDYTLLRTMNSTDAGGWVARKMKST
jgi:hypothetical protein